MTGENGYPECPDWQLPRPVVAVEDLSIPANIELSDN